MSIPENCTTLVVGGGPGGSYVASALAREGVDVVLLEADVFPRYHIGESMLSSLRHFLRFIDLDEKFDKHGFQKKLGAAFKLNKNEVAFTDFVAANGPNGYAWNVVRSESDELMFRHAGESGAQIFDGVKVNAVEFIPMFDNQEEFSADPKLANPGRPVSATWSRKADGSSGTIRFEYLVDASGRAGLISTKYLKNRKFNEGLKNIANWGYWKGAGQYAVGTAKENQPFFEALTDASGWCWAIPLHNGTMSVGIVMRQDLLFAKKKELGPSSNSQQFYKEILKLAPGILKLLENAEFVSGVRTASDYSYSADEYAGPYFRIVGDAGCFIDPYFSSGVHLALTSGLSAALTIQAVRRGDCNEITAARWHSNKVTEGYTRFLLVILTALKQIRKQDESVLNDFDEDGFDTAFSFFRPIIQGNADSGHTLTQGEVSKTIDFCLNAYHPVKPEERQAVQRKIEAALGGDSKNQNPQELSEKLTEDEIRVLHSIRARRMLRTEDTLNLNNFRKDVIGGFMPNVKLGNLGLVQLSSQLHAENGEDDAGLERPEPTDVFAIINLENIASESGVH